MTLYIRDTALDIYQPGSSSTGPDLRLTNGLEAGGENDVRSVSLSSRIGETKDSATLTLDNAGGKFTGELYSGCRVEFATSEFETEFARDTTDGQYDNAQYDRSQFGGGRQPLQRRWVGLVRGPVRYDQLAGGDHRQTIEVDATDFVLGKCSDRIVYDSYEGVPISDIVRDILTEHVPEVDQSLIEDVDATTDILPQGSNVLEVLVELSDQADAVLAAEGDALVFRPPNSIERSFDLQTLGQEPDVGLYSTRAVDDALVNDIRVDGGTARDVDSEQTTVDSYQLVTESDYLTHQIGMRKSEVDQLELWTRADRDGDDLTVRLQKDQNGAPIAPGSSESDIVKKTLSAEFLASDGFTTFIMPEHTLPEPNPWIIVQSGGTSGQEIGVNSATGEPGYRAWYPYPIAVRVQDRDSIAKFGRVQGRIKRKTLRTFDAARNTAQAKLRHAAWPNVEFQADAHSRRAHALSTADVIGLDFPSVGATGDYLVTEQKHEYGPDSNARNILETTLSAREVATI